MIQNIFWRYLLAIFMSMQVIASTPPKKMAILFGGNDGPESFNTNQFSDNFLSVSKELEKNGWITEVGYDSDPKTLKEKSGIKGNVRNATTQDLLDLLDHAIKNLNEGDELLLMINTHGFAGGFDDITFRDQRVAERLKTLRDKNKVKMAFTIESCFGGSGVEPWSEYGCVVSAQSGNAVSGGASISDALMLLMQDPSNIHSIEDVYLKAMAKKHLMTLPQITGFSVGNKLSLETINLQKYNDYYYKTGMHAEGQLMCTGAAANADMLVQIAALEKPVMDAIGNLSVCRYFEGECPSPQKISDRLKPIIEKMSKESELFDKLSAKEKELREKCLDETSEISLNLDQLFPNVIRNYQNVDNIKYALYFTVAPSLRVSDIDSKTLSASVTLTTCDQANILANPAEGVDKMIDNFIKNGLLKEADRKKTAGQITLLFQTAITDYQAKFSSQQKMNLEKTKMMVAELNQIEKEIVLQQQKIEKTNDWGIIELMNMAKFFLYFDPSITQRDSRCKNFSIR